MVTLRHPHLPKVTVDVDAESAPDWVASGWLDDRTKDDTAPKPGPKKPPRSATTR